MAGTADHQKQKIYDSESVWASSYWHPGSPAAAHVSLAEAKRINAEIMIRWGRKPTYMQFNDRLKRYGGWYSPSRGIEFARGPIQVRTVLHETAHALCPTGVHHQWAFAATMLDVVEVYLGVDQMELLRGHYQKAGVIYKEKDDAKRIAKLRAAEQNLRNKHGRIASGYVLVSPSRSDIADLDNPHIILLESSGNYVTSSWVRAKVYRRADAALKKAKFLRGYLVVEVEAEFNAADNGWFPRWEAKAAHIEEAIRLIQKGEQS